MKLVRSKILIAVTLCSALVLASCNKETSESDTDTQTENNDRNDTISSTKEITEFYLDGVKGIINNDEIIIDMPCEKDLTNLIATFKTTGKKVSIIDEEQESGKTINNYSNEVTYDNKYEYSVYQQNVYFLINELKPKRGKASANARTIFGMNYNDSLDIYFIGKRYLGTGYSYGMNHSIGSQASYTTLEISFDPTLNTHLPAGNYKGVFIVKSENRNNKCFSKNLKIHYNITVPAKIP